MDANTIAAYAAKNWLPFALGYASAHAVQFAPQFAGAAFRLALRVPWVRAGIAANPARAKAIVDAIQQELDKDIDETAAPEQPAAPPPPGTLAQ